MSHLAEPSLQILVQDYFTHYLRGQKNVSLQTVASYRDAFRLYFEFGQLQLKKTPSQMELEDFNADIILEFLSWLEKVRGNLPCTRNLRLAAMRGFLNYVSFRIPRRVELVSRVMSIQRKRGDEPMMGYLDFEEIQAIIKSPNQNTFSGMRDFTLFSVMYNTGARVSEVINIKKTDVFLDGKTGSIQLFGKGRKHRTMPLWGSTVKLLKNWLARPELDNTAHIFVNRNGEALTRSGVEDRLEEAVQKASEQCPSLKTKRVSPHTIRHTTAMHLLQSGVGITIIALWLGHASIKTTHKYLEADLKMKEEALSKLQRPEVRGQRFRATDATLAFLQAL